MPENLIERFRTEAAAKQTMDPATRRNSRFIMPRRLYDSLHEIHRRSLEMAERILEVMEDDEHKFMMEFGRAARRHVMPDIDLIRGEIALYADFLREFSPEDVRPHKTDSVTLPADTALKMARMLHYNNSVLERIMDALKNTGYLKIFTDAKASGLIYNGKSALAEILNLSLVAEIISTRPDKALEPERWPVAVYRRDEESGGSGEPAVRPYTLH